MQSDETYNTMNIILVTSTLSIFNYILVNPTDFEFTENLSGPCVVATLARLVSSGEARPARMQIP